MRSSALLDRDAIAGLIPHAGAMCLLDQVLDWDEQGISALATDIHSTANPLREQGRLRSVVLMEYAAQAAAVHAALTGAAIGGDRAAFIGAVKALRLHAREVSPSAGELLCLARCALSDRQGAIYQLSASAEGELLMEARVVLLLP